MTEVLTQEEIDQLLTTIDGKAPGNNFTDIKDFENYLLKREYKKEKIYGLFEKDVSVLRFFDSRNNENILEDIRIKNKTEGYGNIKIPNTNITLFNYSFCPNCRTVYSFLDVINYFRNPVPDPYFISRDNQFRKDTRVYCSHCGTYFLPSLVISDGTPKKEVQFLCRVQTINEIELFFGKKNIKVLSRKKQNIIIRNNIKAIKNDVNIHDMTDRPTLITNVIQYTPYAKIMNLIDGSNVSKGDLLFDEWN